MSVLGQVAGAQVVGGQVVGGQVAGGYLGAGQVVVGRGVIDTDGERHREAVFVRPDGWLEAAVADAVDVSGTRGVPPATRHAVLAASLERLGGYVEPDAGPVAALSRGDLDQLALGLRRLLLGSPLSLVLRCPNPACREEADVDLTVEDLLADAAEPEPEWFVAHAADGARLVLRSVTGTDELATAATTGSAEQRTAALMARVVRGVRPAAVRSDPVHTGDRGEPGTPGGPGGSSGPGGPDDSDRPDDSGDLGEPDARETPVSTPQDWLALPAAQRTAALLALAREPVAPTTDLQVGCPACGAVLEARIDPLVLLARELRAGGDRLLLETHCLAFHYGWTEEAILALPRSRRWGYLSLLRAQVTGAPLEGAVRGG